MTTMITTVDGISTFKVTTVNHFINIFNNGITNFNTGVSKGMKVV